MFLHKTEATIVILE